MEKSVTMNLRVNPQVKQQAENVLKQLGIPMATAVDAYLRQISLTGGIPFPITLPKAPAEINADNMTNSELRAAITAGYEEMEQGEVQNASAAFAAFHKTNK